MNQENQSKKSLADLMDEKRYGIFTIPKDWFSLDYNFLTYVMSHFMVIRCEYFLLSGELVYHAVSPMFEPVDSAENAPAYMLKVDVDENKKLKGIKVERLSIQKD